MGRSRRRRAVLGETMAKITDKFCTDRFFEIYAKLPHLERRGIITGLDATDRVMLADEASQPAIQLPLLDAPAEADSEGGEID